MTFEPEVILMQISLTIGPGRRATGWIIYPGFPPLMHAFGVVKPILKPSGEQYSLQDFCVLLAYERLPPIYEAMSGHQRLAVREAEEDARIALRAASQEAETAPIDPASRFP